jgi:hypothetical protein
MKHKNNGMQIEFLKAPVEEPINPLVPIIETLMSNVLGGSMWRKYSVADVQSHITSLMAIHSIPKTDKHYILLERKLNRCTNMEQCLTILEEVLF